MALSTYSRVAALSTYSREVALYTYSREVALSTYSRVVALSTVQTSVLALEFFMSIDRITAVPCSNNSSLQQLPTNPRTPQALKKSSV